MDTQTRKEYDLENGPTRKEAAADELTRLDPARFSIHDDDLLHDLCGKHLGPAIQSLLIGLQFHDMTAKSFGADDKRTAEYFVDLARDVRKALVRTWEEDL